MALLDLPTEILESILEHACYKEPRSKLYSYRLVNRTSIIACQPSKKTLIIITECFKLQIDRLSWKDRCWLPPFDIEARPFVYSKNCEVEDEIRRLLSEFLLSSRIVENALQHSLRLAIAVLMNVKEFQIENAGSNTFKDVVQYSDGLYKSYTDPDSRKRFLQIANLLVETTLCVSGPDLRYMSWRPDTCCGDNLPHDLHGDWSNPWTLETFHGLNLDWALATAVMMDDLPTLKAILKSTRTFDGHVILSDTVDATEFTTAADVGWRYDDRGPPWSNALAVAMRKGDYKLATLLMDNYINLVNSYTTVPPHESALEIACQQGSLQMVDLVLDPCRGLDYTSWHAFYAVQMAARCSCPEDGPGTCEERLFIIRLLLDLQSPHRDHQKLKNEVLRQACKWGCMTLVRALVEDIGAQPASLHEKALACAATHGHVEVMEYLLDCDTRHFSLFFAVYDIEFIEIAADREMIVYMENTNASILASGPLEPVKAQYLLTIAKAKDCRKVVDLLSHGGIPD